jgi:transposase
MKYTKEFKLECVMKFKNDEYIEDPPGTRHNSFHAQLMRWVHFYDSMGEIGLDHNRPTLDINQRLELINRVENGESYSSAARSYGIQEGLLSKWHKIYLEKGVEGLQSLKKGRPSMKTKQPHNVINDDKDKTKEELLEEIEYLKAENDYLKKLNALVQKRKAQQQKKK